MITTAVWLLLTHAKELMMSTYPNLQRSLLFKILPTNRQQEILSKATLGEACYELQLQKESALEIDPKLLDEYQTRKANGEEINAIKELGIKINHPFDEFELSDEDNQRLIEVDPARYHPESHRPTPKQRDKFHGMIEQAIKDNNESNKTE